GAGTRVIGAAGRGGAAAGVVRSASAAARGDCRSGAAATGAVRSRAALSRGGSGAMVTDSRTTLGAGYVRPLAAGLSVQRRRAAELRPLNAPSPVRVELDRDGRVVGLWRQGRLTPRRIAAVQDRWRIDDEWWREHPIARM